MMRVGLRRLGRLIETSEWGVSEAASAKVLYQRKLHCKDAWRFTP